MRRTGKEKTTVFGSSPPIRGDESPRWSRTRQRKAVASSSGSPLRFDEDSLLDNNPAASKELLTAFDLAQVGLTESFQQYKKAVLSNAREQINIAKKVLAQYLISQFEKFAKAGLITQQRSAVVACYFLFLLEKVHWDSFQSIVQLGTTQYSDGTYCIKANESILNTPTLKDKLFSDDFLSTTKLPEDDCKELIEIANKDSVLLLFTAARLEVAKHYRHAIKAYLQVAQRHLYPYPVITAIVRIFKISNTTDLVLSDKDMRALVTLAKEHEHPELFKALADFVKPKGNLRATASLLAKAAKCYRNDEFNEKKPLYIETLRKLIELCPYSRTAKIEVASELSALTTQENAAEVITALWPSLEALPKQLCQIDKIPALATNSPTQLAIFLLEYVLAMPEPNYRAAIPLSNIYMDLVTQGVKRYTESAGLRLLEAIAKSNGNTDIHEALVRHLFELLEQFPNNKGLNVAAGKFFRLRNDLENALDYFERAAENKAIITREFCELGETYESRNAFDYAKRCYKRACEYGDFKAHMNMARLLQRMIQQNSSANLVHRTSQPRNTSIHLDAAYMELQKSKITYFLTIAFTIAFHESNEEKCQEAINSLDAFNKVFNCVSEKLDSLKNDLTSLKENLAVIKLIAVNTMADSDPAELLTPFIAKGNLLAICFALQQLTLPDTTTSTLKANLISSITPKKLRDYFVLSKKHEIAKCVFDCCLELKPSISESQPPGYNPSLITRVSILKAILDVDQEEMSTVYLAHQVEFNEICEELKTRCDLNVDQHYLVSCVQAAQDPKISPAPQRRLLSSPLVTLRAPQSPRTLPILSSPKQGSCRDTLFPLRLKPIPRTENGSESGNSFRPKSVKRSLLPSLSDTTAGLKIAKAHTTRNSKKDNQLDLFGSPPRVLRDTGSWESISPPHSHESQSRRVEFGISQPKILGFTYDDPQEVPGIHPESTEEDDTDTPFWRRDSSEGVNTL